MFNRFYQSIFICLSTCLTFSAHAEDITWIAESPNNDMNDPSNWSTNSVPGNTDVAIFDSTLSGVDTNPTENSTSFSVSTFNFLHEAAPFIFTFDNQILTFSGLGITGNETDTSINITNTNNSTSLGDMISFLGGTSTMGAANITSSNSATLTGNHSNTSIGSFSSNFFASGSFSISDGGTITASNTGVDRANGTGNNGIANTAFGQVDFDGMFTAGSDVSVSVSNSGTMSGHNTVQGDAVSIINGPQFNSSGAFQAGNNYSFSVQNSGNDSSLGIGLSNIGQINAAQVILNSTSIIGDNCTMSITNSGINSSALSQFSDFIGYLNDQQFFAAGTFQAGDDFTMTVNNSGTDTSTGVGSQVAVINSNSGTTGSQVLFLQGCTLGNEANISVSNSGTYSGTHSSSGSNVGGMNLEQIGIGDSTSPGSYVFNVGDNFILSASNIGIDSSQGTGGDVVGTVSTDQIAIYTPCTVGDHATITLVNSGNFSGDSSSTLVNVGSSGGSQLNCVSTFHAGNFFTLSASNSGIDTGTGIGQHYIGDLITGQQAGFHNGLILGDNGLITITNSGTNSSNTTNANQVGSFMGYGKQLYVKEQFQAGDNLQIEITNSGFDNSTGGSGNYAGFMNNNTVDQTGSQFHLDDGGTVGNSASIILSNTGTYQGNSTGGNITAVIAGQQFCSVSNFQALDNFYIYASNSGRNNGSGQTNNTVGTCGNSQVMFSGACTVGNDAIFLVTNEGVNNDITGTSNTIAMINGSQIEIFGNFSAGTNLIVSADNSSINVGDDTNFVGKVNGSQINFQGSCTLNDGTIISAINSGTVDGSQIVFGQGFDITSGKVVIQALNTGTLNAFGIDIQGSNAGGNADIILSHSSLYVETTLPTFTIAALYGDSFSTAQSQPTLIINTDATTHAIFAGSIQDFPSISSTLIKTGLGTQTLSGVNTFTGLTEIQGGNLILTGYLLGDVLTKPFGTLEGTGIIVGTLTNNGTVSPGQSIGTLTVGNYINNNGDYDLEVNGLGQSDLINVSGTATLNGGTVIVSSVDGTFSFQQPYTIVTTIGGLSGEYSDAISSAFITPVLTYDLNNVYVTLLSALVNAADATNQFGPAINLDNIVDPNAEQTLLISAIANLSLKDAQDALESLSGFQYTHDVWAAEIRTQRFLRRLYNPLRSLVTSCDCCCPCNNWNTWLEIGNLGTSLHGRNAHKFHSNGFQVTGGLQKGFCSNFTLGIAGSYEYDHLNYKYGKAHADNEYAAIYGLYRPCCFYGLFDLVYGHSKNHVNRHIHAGDLRLKAHSKPTLDTFAFYGEMGMDFSKNCCVLQPFLGIQIERNWRHHFHESNGDGFGLSIDKHNWSSIITRLGFHFTALDIFDCIEASFDFAWNQLWSCHHNTAEGRFIDFGNPFSIQGNNLDRYSFDYELTLATSLFDCVKGYIEAGGETWRRANTYEISAGIVFSW